jgi:hypothetical protein
MLRMSARLVSLPNVVSSASASHLSSSAALARSGVHQPTRRARVGLRAYYARQ